MGEALKLGDPRILGPFKLRSRLGEHDAGVVFEGEDREGRQVTVVVLRSAAAADSAVRDRFEAAIGELAENGKIRDSAPRGPLGWAALDGGLEDALGLLDAAGLTAGGTESGPSFEPHWSEGEAAKVDFEIPGAQAVPAPASPDFATVRRAVAALAAVGVLVAVVFVAFVWSPGGGESAPTFSPPPLGASPSPSKKRTSPVPDGPPGPVAGPTYGKGEDTYHMAYEELPFEFDAPGTWGCLRSPKKPFLARILCLDEGGTFPPSGSGAGGMVAIQKCPSGCGKAERTKLRKDFALDEEDWRKIDSTTMYAEVEGRNRDGEHAVRVAMSHVMGDKAVAVQLTGPPDQKKTMQKLINEIRKVASP